MHQDLSVFTPLKNKYKDKISCQTKPGNFNKRWNLESIKKGVILHLRSDLQQGVCRKMVTKEPHNKNTAACNS